MLGSRKHAECTSAHPSMPKAFVRFPQLFRLQSSLKNSSSGDENNERTLIGGVLSAGMPQRQRTRNGQRSINPRKDFSSGRRGADRSEEHTSELQSRFGI